MLTPWTAGARLAHGATTQCGRSEWAEAIGRVEALPSSRDHGAASGRPFAYGAPVRLAQPFQEAIASPTWSAALLISLIHGWPSGLGAWPDRDEQPGSARGASCPAGSAWAGRPRCASRAPWRRRGLWRRGDLAFGLAGMRRQG